MTGRTPTPEVGSRCACEPVLPTDPDDVVQCPGVWRRWPSGSLACDCGECVLIPAAQR